MSEVTRILAQIGAGDASASERLLPLVYEELRKLAAYRLAHEPPGLTIQPTALVHEAYLRLINSEEPPQWGSQAHFFAAAARAMRRILIESARRRKSGKKGGDWQRIDVDLEEIECSEDSVDLIALDEALTKLAERDERKARLVELRFFTGLTMEQAAEVLDVSVATAYRDWCYARAWLYREVTGESPRE